MKKKNHFKNGNGFFMSKNEKSDIFFLFKAKNQFPLIYNECAFATKNKHNFRIKLFKKYFIKEINYSF